MHEAALVLSLDGTILYRHAPPGATAVYLPDSRDLWEVLWEHRHHLGGVAHTHPWSGVPAPSQEDLTTFSACEAALGARLDWWIATDDQALCFRHAGPDRLDYHPVDREDPSWLDELRALSSMRRSP